MSDNPWGNTRFEFPFKFGKKKKKATPVADDAVADISPRQPSGKAYVAILGVLFVAWMLTGFYIVAADEQAVVKRFGNVLDVKMPGPHYHLPFPIDSVDKAKVTQIHRIEIGYDGNLNSIKNESLMLTGDENIVNLDLIVQYQINDVVAYLYNVADVDDTIKNAAQSAIREVAGKELIDELLTVGKNRVQTETMVILQDMMNVYKAGVRIVAVQLQDVAPPDEVSAAFKDVASAREDKNRFINEADAYANQIIPQARGEAATMLQQAEAYHAKVVEQALGDVARFNQILEEYKKAPNITRKRMYIDAMEQTLRDADIKVFDKNIDNINPFIGLNSVGGK